MAATSIECAQETKQHDECSSSLRKITEHKGAKKHCFTAPDALPTCMGSTSSGCMSSMDRVLERITHVILHNKNATLNSTSGLTSGVCTFKTTLFYRNVCCMFSFMKDSTLPSYTNVDMLSSNSSFNTRSFICL